MSRARGRHRQRHILTRGEELALERAFAEAWQQRAWEPLHRRHQTPAGVCFPTTAAWLAWRDRVQERYGDVSPDLLTVTTCPPVVLVLFQRPGGEWLSAGLIEELVMLTRSGRAERRHRTMAVGSSRDATAVAGPSQK